MAVVRRAAWETGSQHVSPAERDGALGRTAMNAVTRLPARLFSHTVTVGEPYSVPAHHTPSCRVLFCQKATPSELAERAARESSLLAADA